jgi:hypothetical protein
MYHLKWFCFKFLITILVKCTHDTITITLSFKCIYSYVFNGRCTNERILIKKKKKKNPQRNYGHGKF